VPLYQSAEASVYHARWQDLARIVDRCDALIVDAPYSERTHSGHDIASVGANEARRVIDYAAWSAAEVGAFVSTWSPICDGWFVSITDTELAPAWASALEATGRYVFSPLAFVAPGSRVRISGDGPAQWSCWIVVARPKSKPFAKWGSLPGAYVVPPGNSSRSEVVGGKPRWLMERLVEDYSRPGQLVVDPCCGAGTTLAAALRTGRRCIGGDAMLKHAKLAARAVSGPTQRPLIAMGGPE
jgi:site-specific DNA-methyltransferase (adenine-specific)